MVQVSLARSIFPFLEVQTLKLRIIILPNNQPEIILLTAHATKKVALAAYLYCNDRK